MVRSIKRLRLKKLAKKIGQKARGFLLIEGILQVVILGMLAIGCSALFSSQFSLLGASQTGNQAQEVASVEAEYLKQLGYDEVSKGTGVHEKQDMTRLLGNDRGKQWQSKVTLLPPINVGDSDDDKIQIARVDVFKPGENASRYSTEVPLSSQTSSPKPESFSDKGGYYLFPNGLILQWGYSPSTLAKSSESLHLCYFPKPFPHKCLAVNLTTDCMFTSGWLDVDTWGQLASFTNRYFLWAPQYDGQGDEALIRVQYFAIGY